MISRRTFLRYGASVCSAIFVSTGVSGCEGGEIASPAFRHGVASGDPLHERVVIWTRITPEGEEEAGGERLEVGFEVAEDARFERIVNSAVAWTSAASDFTVKIDVANLRPGTVYYYRFHYKNGTSPTGRTRTLPLEAEKVTLAFFSCALFPNGYFNAYDHASKLEGIDAAVHLGDYIYEYGMFDDDGRPAYGTDRAEEIGRVLPPGDDGELRTLDDYRRRYALYRSDTMLQNLHETLPFICIWDDHEVVDNAWSDGAPSCEASAFLQRKKAAFQAYFEWLPIRPDGLSTERIYRSFAFADLLTLHMLDTRFDGRSRPVDLLQWFRDNAPDADTAEIRERLDDPSRTLMSESQWEWLEKELAASSARWNIVGQQVLMGRFEMPTELLAPVLEYVNTPMTEEEKQRLRESIETTARELAELKQRILENDPALTPYERERVEKSLPYDPDAWDGFPAQRERFYRGLRTAEASPTVVFSGDSHNGWCNRLRDSEGEVAAVEVGVPSVSSPGFEAELGFDDIADITEMEKALHLFENDTVYSNLSDRGYVVAEIDRNQIRVHWLYPDNTDSPSYAIDSFRSGSIRLIHPEHTDGEHIWMER